MCELGGIGIPVASAPTAVHPFRIATVVDDRVSDGGEDMDDVKCGGIERR